jgi:hypothetical protein
MKCAFCNLPYSPSVGCCDMAAISLALVTLQYHADCSCQEVKDAMTQLEKRLRYPS